ncbi:MAG: hypothetical protein HOE83_03585 [Alphaproteobacteria bacterium]|jgi:hypothetical protein|nr:hypothetical protein [Alphaproteobacteria bacterium]
MSFYKMLSVFSVFFVLASCGDDEPKESYQEKMEKKREVAIQKREVTLQKAEKRFNAVRFPPSELPPSSYTYAVQDYFDENTGRSHLFRGSVVDIARTPKGYFATVEAAFGGSFRGETIRLELSLPEVLLKKIKSDDKSWVKKSLRLNGKDWIVAKIEGVVAETQAQQNVSGDRDFVRSTSSITRMLNAKGQMIEYKKHEK